MTDVLDGTLDAHSQADLATLSPREAAAKQYHEELVGYTSPRDWWRIALRELPTGLLLGGILGVIGFVRIVLWQNIHIFNYGPHYMLLAITVGFALVGGE